MALEVGEEFWQAVTGAEHNEKDMIAAGFEEVKEVRFKWVGQGDEGDWQV